MSRNPNPSTAEMHELLAHHGQERPALMDILRDIQAEHRCVSPQATTMVATALRIPRVEVASFVSFYAFLTEEPQGRIVIRLCNDVPDRMKGFGRTLDTFKKALGIDVGETTPDGEITLTVTPCIGLSDQAPAALVNEVPVTFLGTDQAWQVVWDLRATGDPHSLVHHLGDGNNEHPLVRSMVKNNLVRPGPLIFSPHNRGQAIRRAVATTPVEVIRQVKAARLRGRGGAGFPTGMKWEFARSAAGDRKFVMCNADEGEPGTFKDRVILTERPDRVFAGMTIAGYAIGASEGVVYLRGEYKYLRAFLEDVLEKRREDGLLGRDVLGKGFDFDIRIQMGAGAYVCGEESALLGSCEGFRGDPKNRPPFPVEHGFLGYPTVVNNVETLACVTKILEEGPSAFAEYGTDDSVGTKLLSISGDCLKEGVYEVPFGVTLLEVLAMAGCRQAVAVQVGGPSGRLVPAQEFDRRISFEDLPTGGALIVFGGERDLLEITRAYTDFFAEESCGYCTPCRVGTRLLGTYLERVASGRADPGDVEGMRRTAVAMRDASRCGLGLTACNPVLDMLDRFPDLYAEATEKEVRGHRRAFDLLEAVEPAERIMGRRSVLVGQAVEENEVSDV